MISRKLASSTKSSGRALGEEFIGQVEKVISSLECSAEITPEYYRGFRRRLTLRFPYKVFYRIERERVLVFRVLHASRDHKRWPSGDIFS